MVPKIDSKKINYTAVWNACQGICELSVPFVHLYHMRMLSIHVTNVDGHNKQGSQLGYFNVIF